MSSADKILGKIGAYVGQKLQGLKDQVDAIDTNNITGDVDVTGDIDGINLTATGDLSVGGHLECDSLLVKGETRVINTTKVELSDDILEINRADDGTAVSNESGLAINAGSTLQSTTTNNYSVIAEDTATNDVTGVSILAFVDENEPNVMGNPFLPEGDGIWRIDLQVARTSGSVNVYAEFEPNYNRLIDAFTGTRYGLRYEFLIGSDYYVCYPIWSETATSTTILSVEDTATSSTLNSLSSAYLRGFRFRYATTYDVVHSEIRQISYANLTTDQAKLLWNNSEQDWTLYNGSNIAVLNADVNISTGNDLVINDEPIGEASEFEDYLNDSL